MKNRAIITSALPYANGEIHLGHVASTYIPADVTTRFLRLKGVEAYYVCASDDYGTPILVQSEKKGQSPQEYAKYWNSRDAEDFAALDVKFDLFYRTSSPENVKFVQDVFCKLQDAGHIYEKDVVQFYCETDKKFLPDRYVKGKCPYCGADDQYSDLCEKCGRVPEEILHPKCSICANTPVKKSSMHYFFKLGSFAEKLGSWLESHENLQSDVKKYVQNWIKSGLEDWDITRDIPWGVPVPGSNSENKVFYGWFDNHLAYISTAVKLLESKGYDGKKPQFWNSQYLHQVGISCQFHSKIAQRPFRKCDLHPVVCKIHLGRILHSPVSLYDKTSQISHQGLQNLQHHDCSSIWHTLVGFGLFFQTGLVSACHNHQRRTRNTPLLPLVSKTVLLHQLGYRWMPHAPNVSRHLHMAKR